MADLRNSLSPLRQSALAAWEDGNERLATGRELELIAHKDIRRGSSVFCVMGPLDDPSVGLGVQGEEYATKGKLTASGGGLHDDVNEDSISAALRELSQEVVDDEGNPIIQDIDPDSLKTLYSAWDLSMLQPGHAHPEWDMVFAEVLYTVLFSADTKRAEAHAKRLLNDPVYAQASFDHTKNPDTGKNEIGGFQIHKLRHAVQPSVTDQMQHRHEKQGLIILGQRLVHG